MWNRTEHGLSWLTAISDAGSTPAASTILKQLILLYLMAMFIYVCVQYVCTRSLIPLKTEGFYPQGFPQDMNAKSACVRRVKIPRFPLIERIVRR